jgi:hypothetical protein
MMDWLENFNEQTEECAGRKRMSPEDHLKKMGGKCGNIKPEKDEALGCTNN